MITADRPTTTCHARAPVIHRRTNGAVPQMMPICITPRRTMANVGGVMLVRPAPGTPSIATGYHPIHVTTTSHPSADPATSRPLRGEMPPWSSQRAQ